MSVSSSAWDTTVKTPLARTLGATQGKNAGGGSPSRDGVEHPNPPVSLRVSDWLAAPAESEAWHNECEHGLAVIADADPTTPWLHPDGTPCPTQRLAGAQ